MAAPTPASAYLHSATMVKAGVFLLVRFWPVLSGTDEWFFLLGLAGMCTLVLGAYFAIFQQDLKGLLAYSTISHLGLITMLLSFGSPLAAVAAIFHMMNHATFKASLFMAAGIIDHEAGTRDMRRLSGLFSYLPITATLAMVASAAMAGVPLLNGFLSKEMFFAQAIETHQVSLLDSAAPYVATIAGAFAVTYSVRFIHTVFFGPKPVDLPRVPHEPPHWMRVPIELLVLACLIVGIIPGISIGPFLHVAAVSVLGDRTPVYSLAVWHGFNYPLLMSVIAMVAGLLLYALLRRYLERSEEGPPGLRRLKGQPHLRAHHGDGVLALGALVGRRISAPAACSSNCAFWSRRRFSPRSGRSCRTRPGAAAAYRRRVRSPLCDDLGRGHRLRRRRGLSGQVPPACRTDPVGWRGTYHLRHLRLAFGARPCRDAVARRDRHNDSHTAWSALAAEAAGESRQCCRHHGSHAQVPGRLYRDRLRIRYRHNFLCDDDEPAFPQTIGDFFLQRAYSEGGGTNVVNVILVDFRGFDTMGEITVLAIVALTVFALLRRFRPAPDSIEVPEQQRVQNRYDDAEPDREIGETLRDYLMVPSVIMQWMFPVIIVLAAYLFLRGHDLPGGGFAAGVALSIGFLLQYLAGGTRWVEDRLRILPVRWMGARPAAVGLDRDRFVVVRLSFPHIVFPISGIAPGRQSSRGDSIAVRSRSLLARGRRNRADARRDSPSIDPQRIVFARPKPPKVKERA